MIGLLLAIASTPLSNVHLPACAIYVRQRNVGTARIDADLVRQAAQSDAPTVRVDTVMATDGWRLIWAQPPGSEEGVFIFRRASHGYRLADIWGGVAQRSERADVVAWAAKLGMPAALAQCFASRVIGGDR